jgi:hypothetical protein
MLLVLVLITVANILARRQDEGSRSLIAVGDRFTLDAVNAEGTQLATEECALAFLVHPACSACRRLAKWFRDEEAEGRSPLWISLADHHLTARFVDEFDLDGKDVFLLDADRGVGAGEVGVPGVPTAVLVSKQRVAAVQTGVPASGPPFDGLRCHASGERASAFLRPRTSSAEVAQ